MPVELLVMLIIGFASFVQAVSGFGQGLVAMPLLTQLIGRALAAPIFALIALVAEIIVILRYRHALTLKRSWRLMVAALLTIPIGIIGAPLIPERILLLVLGVIVLAYAIYALVSPRIPALKDPRWGFGFGAVSGLLSGAFNTGGPPLVMYGATQRWQPHEFKANLQGLFLVSSVTLIMGHTLTGALAQGEVWRLALFGLGGMAVGLTAGFSLDRRISAARFRTLVQVMLIILGLTLIF